MSVNELFRRLLQDIGQAAANDAMPLIIVLPSDMIAI
jgi:hypothetical protein